MLGSRDLSSRGEGVGGRLLLDHQRVIEVEQQGDSHDAPPYVTRGFVNRLTAAPTGSDVIR